MNNDDWITVEEVMEITGYQKSKVYSLKDDTKIAEKLGAEIKFTSTDRLRYYKPQILELAEIIKQQKIPPRVISVINQKGGVAKSTSAICMSTLLAQKGKKTLIIDCDYVQGNTTSVFHDEEHQLKKSDKNLFSFFDNMYIIEEVIHSTRIDNLYIIPSSIRIAEMDLENINKTVLKRGLESTDFNYVILDLPPSLSNLTYLALIASSDVIIPVPPGLFEIEGLVGIKKSITLAKKYNPDLNTLGAFITIAERNTKGFKVIEEILPQYFNLAKTYIRKREAVKNAYLEKRSIVEVDKKNAVTKDYKNLIKELLNE